MAGQYANGDQPYIELAVPVLSSNTELGCLDRVSSVLAVSAEGIVESRVPLTELVVVITAARILAGRLDRCASAEPHGRILCWRGERHDEVSVQHVSAATLDHTDRACACCAACTTSRLTRTATRAGGLASTVCLLTRSAAL